MKVSLGASLAAVLCLCAGSALAGSAVLNSDMTAFEGRGDNYRPVLNPVAGQRIDILACSFKQWCQVEHDSTLGWVHAVLTKPAQAGDDGPAGTPGAGTPGSNPSDTANGDAGGSSGSKVPKFSKVGGEIAQTADGGSSGGSGGGTTARLRASGGGSGNSSPPAAAATEAAPASGDVGTLATASKCRAC